METLKNALAFYPLYVVLMTVVFKTIQPDDGQIVGFLSGIATYPVIWYCYIIMSIKDKDERNGENTSNTCERENNNGR